MKLGKSGLVVLYTCTIFIGAALLFFSEFMIAKMLLPLFGGTSAVWTTCMVFFQGALLLGYFYAHYSVKKFGLKFQPWLHIGLVCIALLSLPFALPAWAGAQDMPVLNILAVLTVAIGVPFFVVSATGPLLQYWFASTTHPHAKNPYFLYAASNFGSFLALVAYPFAVEPVIGLKAQSSVWAAGYGIFAALVAVCAVFLYKFRSKAATAKVSVEPQAKTSWKTRLYWLFLAALPSSLMLGVTSYITTDVAAMPMLWMVPLALYLLTFVVAFGYSKPKILVAKFAPIAAAALVGIVLVTVLPSGLPRAFNAVCYIIFFVLISLLAHSRLSEKKPEPARLTEFYLWVAAGGVVGGMFNSLIAPLLFNDVYEFAIALLLCIPVLVPIAYLKNHLNMRTFIMAGFGVLCAITLFAINKLAGVFHYQLVAMLLGGVSMAAYVLYTQKPQLYAAFLLPIMFVPVLMLASSEMMYTQRTFYSVLKIFESDGTRKLNHGITLHGGQHTDPQKAKVPISYYQAQGPVGDIFKACRAVSDCRSVGVLGLGVGTIAAYGRGGDSVTFYEIDPAVKDIAYNKNYFTYVTDSKANIQTVLGDGRLTLDDDKKSFDVLIVDAFSSDAIPTHLLTSEAIKLYKNKLNGHGLLALHISNNNLNLEPIVKAAAREQDLSALIRRDKGSDNPQEFRPSSVWVVLSKHPQDVDRLKNIADWKNLQGRDVRVWNDDYSNVIDALIL